MWIMKPPPVVTAEVVKVSQKRPNQNHTHAIRVYTRTGKCFLVANYDQDHTIVRSVFLYADTGASFDVVCSAIHWLEKVVESSDPLAYLENALK